MILTPCCLTNVHEDQYGWIYIQEYITKDAELDVRNVHIGVKLKVMRYIGQIHDNLHTQLVRNSADEIKT